MPRTAPTLESIAEELALEVMARAREDAAHALENKRLANRLLALAAEYRATRSEVAAS